MDSRFIGVRVQVTFKSTTAQTVQGFITAVAPGISLTLKNVTVVSRPGTVLPSLVIHLEHVKGVTVIENVPPSASVPPPKSAATQYAAPAPIFPQPAPVSAPISPTKQLILNTPPNPIPNTNTITEPAPPPEPLLKPKPQATAFVDPAIVSMGRSSSTVWSGHASDAAKSGAEVPNLTSSGSTTGPAIPTPNSGHTMNTQPDAVDVSAVEASVAELGLGSIKPRSIRSKFSARENRISRNRRNREQNQQRQNQHYQNGSGRGKGWRNTPLLEDVETFQPFNALKRNSQLAASGPWAQDDFTDKNEFDFEESLAKFDKRTVFEEITKCDTIREDERLVFHNLKAKPGTAGGKNLHPTENVLDKPSTLRPKHNDDYWNSEADVHIEDRRSNKSARKPDVRPGLVRQQSLRKASVVLNMLQPSSRVNSQVRRAVRIGSIGPILALTSGQLKDPIAGFYVMPSNRYIDPISPLQMITLENTAVNELGLPELVMVENASRGIASVALKLLEDPAVRHGLGVAATEHTLTDLIQKCVMLVLAGNNKSGARAISTARQLRSKGMEVILCVVDIDRESVLMDAVKHQVRLYRNYGGRVYDKQELFDLYRSAKDGGSPIMSTLIIDGLLGLTVPFEELRTAEQTTVYELIHWVDKDPGFVISLDIPSGLDPVTGKISIVDGMPLYVKPRYVVAIAAPKRGLAEAIYPTVEEDLALNSSAEALRSTVTDGHEWNLFVVDIGFDSAVWKRAGVKARHPVDFSGQWTCQLQFRVPVADSDDD